MFFLFLFAFRAKAVLVDPDFENDTISWISLSNFTDPFQIDLPNFSQWTSTNLTHNLSTSTSEADISPNEEISVLYEIQNIPEINFTKIYFYFPSTIETDFLTASLILTEGKYSISAGQSINITISEQIQTITVRITNFGTSYSSVFLPVVIFYTTASKTDYSISQRSMVFNHAKAIRCSLFLDASFCDLEIETVRLPNIHPIPDEFLPLNQQCSPRPIPHSCWGCCSQDSTSQS